MRAYLLVGLLAAGTLALSQPASRPQPAPAAPAKPVPVPQGAPQRPVEAPGPALPAPRLSTANQAYQAALGDLHTAYPWWTGIPNLEPGDAPFIRWLWNQYGSVEDAKAAIAELNMVSRAGALIVRPVPVITGNIFLLRLDLRQIAPIDSDLQDWLKAWEDLQFDPKFSLLFTHDMLERMPKNQMPKKQRRRLRRDGQPGFIDEMVPLTEFKEDLIRLPPAHINPELYDRLTKLTSTQAPVVSVDYFTARTMASIKDDGLFNDLYGGRYVEFSGLKRAKKGEKASDLDVLFDDLGIGNIQGKLTADQLFDRLRSDFGCIMRKSGVTGKKRLIRLFHGPQNRSGTGRVGITSDVKDKNIDLRGDPFLFVLSFKPDAHEVIFERANGFHGFALYNGAGALQDEVPFDIANDSTIPHPYTQRLQYPIGCLRCHGVDDGWKPPRNDFATMLGDYGADVLADRSKRSPYDAVNRIAGEFGEDPANFLSPLNKALRRGRADYADQMLLAIGSSWNPKESTVKLVSGQIGSIWGRYFYEQVDAARALQELGLPAGKDGAVKTLASLLAPEGDGIIIENPTVRALRKGQPVNRVDWDLLYGFVAARAYPRLKGDNHAVPDGRRSAAAGWWQRSRN